jgi:hypothetical protein
MPIVRRTDYIKTACGVCLVVLAAVLQSWDTNCVNCVKDAAVVQSWVTNCVHCVKDAAVV